jgi:peroxiredoxin
MGSARMHVLLLLLPAFLAGCGNNLDNLYPSGADKRPQVQCGIPGVNVCQNALDFTLSDTLGNSVTLSSVISTAGVRGTVLYFTMWCPICDTHMSNMQDAMIPQFPAVRFFAVDWVSGSVAEAGNAESSNGFVGSGFTVLADTHKTVLNLYEAAMGTTVVIDRNGVVRMNEDYKDGARLQSALAGLP